MCIYVFDIVFFCFFLLIIIPTEWTTFLPVKPESEFGHHNSFHMTHDLSAASHVCCVFWICFWKIWRVQWKLVLWIDCGCLEFSVTLLPAASQWIHHQSGLLLEIVQCLIFGWFVCRMCDTSKRSCSLCVVHLHMHCVYCTELTCCNIVNCFSIYARYCFNCCLFDSAVVNDKSASFWHLCID